MPLREVYPLNEKQWAQVQKMMKDGPTKESIATVETALKRVKGIRRDGVLNNRTSDTKKKTVVEVLFNITISFPIHYFANFLILPFYGDQIQNLGYDLGASALLYLEIGVWFTLVSLVRQFGIRRLFNRFGFNETGFYLLLQQIKRLRK